MSLSVGIDDNVCGKGSLISSHNQLAQMSNYNRYLKKRAIQENRTEEEQQQNNSTLVNLSNKNALTMQFNAINMQDPNTSNMQLANASNTSKQSISETSFINIEQQSKSMIVEKSLLNARGDAV